MATSGRGSDAIDTKIESLCGIIMKTDVEDWEKRNKALNSVRDLIVNCNREPNSARLSELSMHTIFRALKEPVKSMISDLRSQQVRDTCALLSVMSECFGDRLKLFMRDTFAAVLEGIKVPNKVMSGYVNDCIMYLIANVTFKSAVPLITAEVRESKAKHVKERCMEYIIEILVHWDLNDRELDMVVDAITAGLEDGSNDTRDKAKVAYINVYHLFPDRAKTIKEALPRMQQNRLTKAEQEDEMLFQLAQSADDEGIIPLNVDTVENVIDPIMRSNESDPDIQQKQQNGALTKSEKSMLASTLPTGSSLSLVGSSNNAKETPGFKKNLQGSDRLANTIDSSELLGNLQNATKSTTKNIQTPGNAKKSGTSTTTRGSMVAAGSKSLMKPTASSLRKQQQSTSDSSSNRTESESVESAPSNNNTSPNSAVQRATNSKAGDKSLKLADTNATTAYVSAKVKEKQQIELRQADAERQSKVRQTLLNRRKSVVSNPFANIIVTSPVNASGEGGVAAKFQRHNSTSALSQRTAAYQLAASGGGDATQANITPMRTHSANSVFGGVVSNRHSFSGTRSSLHPGSPTKIGSSTPSSPQRQKQELSPTLAAISEAGIVNSLTGADSPFHGGRPHSATYSPTNKEKSIKTPLSLASRSMAEISTPKTESRPAHSNSELSSSQDYTLNETPVSANKNSLFPKNLSIGMHVKVTSEKDIKLPGIIRFIGHTSFASGIWVGVELFAPLGKNDGTVHGQRYFNCKSMYGIFVREMHIEVPQMVLDAMAAEAAKENNAQHLKVTSLSSRYQAKTDLSKTKTNITGSGADEKPQGDIPAGIIANTDGTDALSLDTSITAATGQSAECGERSHQNRARVQQSASQYQQPSLHCNAAYSAMHCAKVHDMLKLKLSQMMETLNQQIEILNDLDREELNRRNGKLDAKRITELHSEVLSLTTQEVDLISTFKKRYTKLLEEGSAGPN